MCNLYNVTTTQEAIRQFTKTISDISGIWNRRSTSLQIGQGQ